LNFSVGDMVLEDGLGYRMIVLDVIVGHAHHERVLTRVPDDSGLDVGLAPRRFVEEYLACAFTSAFPLPAVGTDQLDPEVLERLGNEASGWIYVRLLDI